MSKFIVIENVHKTYYQKNKPAKQALIDINLTLHKGEIVSLLGVNGAGKTTLSSIIASLHPPTKGNVLWKSQPIHRVLAEYRKIVGLCPQQQNLDPHLSLEQTLIFQGKYYGLALHEIQDRVRQLLDTFSLQPYAKAKADVLSGGYKQRFLLARALIHRPELVILDEPTVGLDPQVRHTLWDTIANLKKENICVLLTTHYLDEAEHLSDRVCVMDQGKIKIIDTPEKLKTDWKKKNLEDVFLHLLQEESTC
jgi:ABC-2 type transport system ATP-binding protein